MNIEGFLTKRMIWAVNAIGLILVYLGFLMWIPGNPGGAVLGFARCLLLPGGGRDRAARRDHVVDDRDGLAADVERLRLHLDRVRVEALLVEVVPRLPRERRGLLRVADRAVVGGENQVDVCGLQVPGG